MMKIRIPLIVELHVITILITQKNFHGRKIDPFLNLMGTDNEKLITYDKFKCKQSLRNRHFGSLNWLLLSKISRKSFHIKCSTKSKNEILSLIAFFVGNLIKPIEMKLSMRFLFANSYLSCISVFFFFFFVWKRKFFFFFFCVKVDIIILFSFVLLICVPLFQEPLISTLKTSAHLIYFPLSKHSVLSVCFI